MEFMLVMFGIFLLSSVTLLYIYLVDNNKIEPYTPRPIEREQVYRGNFWDAETKKYYKWDKLMELKKEREQNDTT